MITLENLCKVVFLNFIEHIEKALQKSMRKNWGSERYQVPI